MNSAPASSPLPAWGRVLGVSISMAAVAAAGAGFTIFWVRSGIEALTEAGYVAADATAVGVFQAGLQAAVFAALLLVTVVGAPVAWRSLSNPRHLRTVALIAVMLPAIALGVLLPGTPAGVVSGAIMAGIGGVWWLVWSSRWRGSGVAPSLLTGVLRPKIHPGQMWFAYVQGHQVSKVRPVLVLAEAEKNRWKIAYFTSATPKTHLAHKYVQAPAGTLRGLTSDNYLEVQDARMLRRNDFRKYVGLAPVWLYQQACAHTHTPTAPDALVIDEQHAGEHMGPMERSIYDAITRGGHAVENAWLWDVIRSFSQIPVRSLRRKDKSA